MIWTILEEVRTWFLFWMLIWILAAPFAFAEVRRIIRTPLEDERDEVHDEV